MAEDFFRVPTTRDRTVEYSNPYSRCHNLSALFIMLPCPAAACLLCAKRKPCSPQLEFIGNSSDLSTQLYVPSQSFASVDTFLAVVLTGELVTKVGRTYVALANKCRVYAGARHNNEKKQQFTCN